MNCFFFVCFFLFYFILFFFFANIRGTNKDYLLQICIYNSLSLKFGHLHIVGKVDGMGIDEMGK